MSQKKVEIGAKMAKNYIKKKKEKKQPTLWQNFVKKVENIIFLKPKLGQKRHKKFNSQVKY